MVLILWWILPLGLILLAGMVFWAFRRRDRDEDRLLAAHTDRLTALPGYVRALRKRRWMVGALMASLAVLALGTLLAAARPAVQTVSSPEKSNRDIMLCLDVSGSMVTTDAEVVQVFTQLAQDFSGERLGLVIFDSSAVQVFPLTDDYDFVKDQLAVALDAMKDDTNTSYFAGVYSGKGSSLIGDGLATCVNSFPKTPDGAGQRSQSVILATDNVVFGKPIFTTEEAAALAVKQKVRVYGLNPTTTSASNSKTTAANAMKVAVQSTGGEYYALKDGAAVKDIASKIQATEATKVKSAPQVRTDDHPEVWLLLSGAVLLGVLVVAWRLKL
ncbi:VWA domain-containing protein [Psychromicrobium xiongbiense]|uniref:VWA domain-containing protein n=1 Tax=Psychromicrobium xiongbiense TaxID=3051184 RepID=UPI0025578B69|nr:VWA domain-containing protein [Psychromicrobium sp. YIM S02556]